MLRLPGEPDGGPRPPPPAPLTGCLALTGTETEANMHGSKRKHAVHSLLLAEPWRTQWCLQNVARAGMRPPCSCSGQRPGTLITRVPQTGCGGKQSAGVSREESDYCPEMSQKHICPDQPCLLKHELWCWACNLNFPGSSKVRHPEPWAFLANLCFSQSYSPEVFSVPALAAN